MKANGPNTYVPSKQLFTEVSSFDQLTVSSQNNHLNEERVKKVLKSKNEHKKLLTPQRTAKRVAPNRGIALGHSKEGLNQTSGSGLRMMDSSLDKPLHNTHASLIQSNSKNHSPLIQSQKISNRLNATGHDSTAFGYSPKASIISDITKGGNRLGMRQSEHTMRTQDDRSSEQVMIDKQTYQELINYIAKADRIKLDPERTAQIINIYTDGQHLKLKPNLGQQKIKLSTSQSRSNESQLTQTS